MTPDKHTIAERMLSVGDGHKLYIQEWGKKDSRRKFLFLHGGPGSGCGDSHKNYFNPETDYVIFFDQRGCGKSIPYGSLESNTTSDLVSDINKILEELGVHKVVVVGGSWGSTLALAYTLEYQPRVKSLIIRGIFTGSQQEVDFMDKGGFRYFFPDVWQRFVDSVPKQHQSDPATFHTENLFSGNEESSKAASLAYSDLEGSIASLDDRTREASDDLDPVPMKIEVHYTRQLCFMPDRHLLDNAAQITVPVTIIQGRYDTVCPPITAWELSQKLPNSRLFWTQAGHSGNDRANFEATKQAVALAY